MPLETVFPTLGRYTVPENQSQRKPANERKTVYELDIHVEQKVARAIILENKSVISNITLGFISG